MGVSLKIGLGLAGARLSVISKYPKKKCAEVKGGGQIWQSVILHKRTLLVVVVVVVVDNAGFV
jgi:hypothetical protein